MSQRLTLMVLSYMLPILLGSQQPGWELTTHPTDYPPSALYMDSEAVYSGTFGAGMFISVDEGDTWEECDTPTGTVSDILGLNDGTMLVAYLGGGVRVVSSECAGYYTDTVGLGNRFVTSLTTDGEHIYAGTYQGVYTRSLQDRVWHTENLPAGSYSSHVHSILWTPFGLIAGGSEVAFYRLKGSLTWQVIKLDQATDIISLAYSDQQLVIGTSGRGAYLFSIADSVWTSPALASGLPLDGIITLIQQAGNGELISLSTTQGLSYGEAENASAPQLGYPRDYVRSGELEFLAYHEVGVLRRGRGQSVPIGIEALSLNTGSILAYSGEISIYPTLVTSDLTIKLSEALDIPLSINLIDATGKRVGQGKLASGTDQYQFNALRLPAGLYWCEVALPTGSFVRSFIIRQ